ncbi:MAG: 3-isopropylmalate dehydratase, small subunit [Acidobacteria bacterium]|nr:3-isopropylmalate dehydratase, small subunit [Acidobacteriota bacterium]
MKSYRSETGLVAPLARPNIDTDQILPKQFLKRVERTGFGEFVFYDWRFRPDGTPDESFALNQPRYQGASILIAGENFGCGSSREHAPWGLLDYGFHTIIATSFADIFYNNCFKNGMLPVVLPETEVDELLQKANEIEGYHLTVDLEKQEISDESGFKTTFRVAEFRRFCLLNGLDDIGLTLRHESEIAAFEKARPEWRVFAA